MMNLTCRTVREHPRPGRFRPTLHLGLALAIVALASPTALYAQSVEQITKVEEDWVLILTEPDGNLFSPQFHTTMAPSATMDPFFVQVTWNYRELPICEPGGFQIQGWQGEEVEKLRSFDMGELYNQTETITWTQVMGTNGAEAAFAIFYGASSTWGEFGGLTEAVSGFPGIQDLNSYSPEDSVANSWVTFGANRVLCWMITEVRYYTTNNMVYIDTKPRVVHGTNPLAP